MITASLNSQPSALNQWRDEPLIAELRERGYQVFKSESGWMTLGELALLTHYNPAALSRTLTRHKVQYHTEAPGLTVERGPQGRIIRVQPSATFHQWIAAGVKL